MIRPAKKAKQDIISESVKKPDLPAPSRDLSPAIPEYSRPDRRSHPPSLQPPGGSFNPASPPSGEKNMNEAPPISVPLPIPKPMQAASAEQKAFSGGPEQTPPEARGYSWPDNPPKSFNVNETNSRLSRWFALPKRLSNQESQEQGKISRALLEESEKQNNKGVAGMLS